MFEIQKVNCIINLTKGEDQVTGCTYVLSKQKDQGNLTGTTDLKRGKKIPFPSLNSGSTSYFKQLFKYFLLTE